LSLVRCPDGQAGTCFFQKHPAVGTPQNLRRVPVKEKNTTEDYVVVDDEQGLISLAQIGVLEIHAWGSTADDLERPNRIIFDLDPDPSVDWPQVVESARQIRAFLQDLGLESFLKTTGGKGLHLVVPIDRKLEWPDVKVFCHQVADAVVQAEPSHYTATMSKAARKGKIFIDYLRNDRGSTAVAPYSPRSKPGAPVSVPIAWKELTPRLKSDHFTIRTATERLKKADPWAAMEKTRQSLARPWKQLQALLKR
jgi:bifunctional non-homologous end joining protein LigD